MQPSASSTDWTKAQQQAFSTLSKLSPEVRKTAISELRRRIEHIRSRRKLWTYYPDQGNLRRDLYPRHLEFFADGAQYTERAIVAANRSGKSTAAGYEMALHLTGEYPNWWVGRRFDRNVTCWASGEDSKSIRESLQLILFGPLDALGTGMIPGDNIVGKPAMARGGVDIIDSCSIKHVSGKTSRLVLKSYEQGREAFQAAKVDVGWCDEEPPLAIYNEFLTRLMSTVPGEPNGIMMGTWTPLKGMSEVVMAFLGEDWRRPELGA